MKLFICKILIIFFLVGFSLNGAAEPFFNSKSCTFNTGDDLGICFLNMTGEDLSGKGIALIELAKFEDNSRGHEFFDIHYFPLNTYTVISTSAVQMKKDHTILLIYGLSKLGGDNPQPMDCQLTINRSTYGKIKIVRKNGKKYYCE